MRTNGIATPLYSFIVATYINYILRSLLTFNFQNRIMIVTGLKGSELILNNGERGISEREVIQRFKV